MVVEPTRKKEFNYRARSPISVTEKQFDEHICPYIREQKVAMSARSHSTKYSIMSFTIFHILHVVKHFSISPASYPSDPTKHKSVTMPLITIFASGAVMVV